MNCGLLSQQQRYTLSWVFPPSWLPGPMASCKIKSALTLGSLFHLFISLLYRVIIIVRSARYCPSILRVPVSLWGGFCIGPTSQMRKLRGRGVTTHPQVTQLGKGGARMRMDAVWLQIALA